LNENQKKFELFFEINLEKVRNELSQENSIIKAENSQLKKNIEEILYEKEQNFLRKSEHFQLVGEFEELIQEIKKENEGKEERFHCEIMQKQRFFEEKFAKDVEIIELSSKRRVFL